MSLKDRIKQKKQLSAPQLAPRDAVKSQEYLQKCDEIKNEILDYLKKIFNYSLLFEKTEEERKAVLTETIEKYMDFNCRDVFLSWSEKQKMISEILSHSNWFGPLLHLLEDEKVSVIYVNGVNSVFVEKDFKCIQTADTFKDDEHLASTIKNLVSIVDNAIWESESVCCAKLPNGITIKAVFPPLAAGVGYLVIKKFNKTLCNFNELIKREFITDEISKFLKYAFEKNVNIIVAGEQSSAKTTLLAALVNEISPSQRVVFVKDSQEIDVTNEAFVTLNVNKQSAETLIEQAKFLAPQSIIYPDIEKKWLGDFIRNTNAGCVTTVSTSNDAEILSLLSGSCKSAQLSSSTLFATTPTLLVRTEKTQSFGFKLKSISQLLIKDDELSLEKIIELKTVPTDNGGNYCEYQSFGIRPNFVSINEFDEININPRFFDEDYEHEYVHDVIAVEQDVLPHIESELDKAFKKTKKLSIKSRFAGKLQD